MARIDTKVTHGIGGHADTVFLRVLSDLNGLKIIRAHSRHSLTKKKSVPFCTSGVHRVYTILGEPKPPWDNTPNNPRNAWVSALDFACNWASGARSEASAVSQITTGAYSKFGKTYDGTQTHTLPNNPCHLSDIINGSKVDCKDMSAVVCLFTRLTGGATAQVRRVNGDPLNGFAYKTLLPIGIATWRSGIWSHHQFAWFNGKVYDACVKLKESTPYIPVNDDLDTSYKPNVWDTTKPGNWIPATPHEIMSFD